jgi:hypothetical protein
VVQGFAAKSILFNLRSNIMRVLITSFFVLAASVSSSLAHPAGGGAVREACRADVEKLCQGIRPGDGRLRACLKSNKDRISEGCKTAITAAIQARREGK